jgi:hypothetical protein
MGRARRRLREKRFHTEGEIMADFRRILSALKKQEQRLEKQLASIRSAIGSLAAGVRTGVSSSRSRSRAGVRRKRRVSAAARAKMAAAQRARWARVRKQAQKG